MPFTGTKECRIRITLDSDVSFHCRQLCIQRHTETETTKRVTRSRLLCFHYCMQFVFDVCRTHGLNPVAQSMDVVVVSVRCVGVNQIREVEPVEQ